MKVKPVLDSWEIPHIATIDTLERRSFVELPVPGRVGSLYQDMNLAPTRIVITGSLYGDDARDDFLEEVRGKFRAGEPVTFVADIVTATDVQYVVIESLRFQESGRAPDQIEYYLVLRESPPPPPPPNPLGDMEAGLDLQADSFLDSVTGALDLIDALGDIPLGSVPDLADPTPPLTSALDGVTSATQGLESALAPLQDIFGSS